MGSVEHRSSRNLNQPTLALLGIASSLIVAAVVGCGRIGYEEVDGDRLTVSPDDGDAGSLAPGADDTPNGNGSRDADGGSDTNGSGNASTSGNAGAAGSAGADPSAAGGDANGGGGSDAAAAGGATNDGGRPAIVGAAGTGGEGGTSDGSGGNVNGGGDTHTGGGGMTTTGGAGAGGNGGTNAGGTAAAGGGGVGQAGTGGSNPGGGGSGSPIACMNTANCTCETNAGHSYWFCTSLVVWNDAQLRCESAGMDLVRIDDDTENGWLVTTATADGVFDTTQFVLIGASDPDSTGSWAWVDGEVFWQGGSTGSAVNGLYANWSRGNPSVAGTGRCSGMFDSGLWSTRVCTDARPFICEQP